MTEFLGIERMVLVQPTYYGEDNALTLDVLQRLGPRCGAVVRIARTRPRPSSTATTRPGCGRSGSTCSPAASWPTEELIAYIRRMAGAHDAARLAPAVLHAGHRRP